MPHRIILSKRVVESLPVPEKGRKYTYDATVRSLAICVTDNGTRTWYRCGKVKGKAERFRIGRFPEITVDEARKFAAGVTLDIASGRLPTSKRRSTKTLGQLWEWFLPNHAKENRKTCATDERRWEKELKQWALRRLDGIERHEIISLRNEIKERRGPSGANNVLKLLSSMYAVAIKNKWTDANPVLQSDLFEEHERERFLDASELPKLFAALETVDEQPRDFFLLCLWTGARKSNVAGMRWADLNLDTGVWTVVRQRSKNKKQMRLVLAEPAIEILLRRRDSHPESEWVFPSQKSPTGHYTKPRASWVTVLKRAGLSDVWIHDLRRTLGSWQMANGANLEIIAKSLGHANTQSTKIYARLNLDPVRKSVQAAVDAMQSTKATPEKNS